MILIRKRTLELHSATLMVRYSVVGSACAHALACFPLREVSLP